MRLANGIVLDKEKTFEVQSAGTHDTGIYPSGNPCQGLPVQCRGGAYQSCCRYSGKRQLPRGRRGMVHQGRRHCAEK